MFLDSVKSKETLRRYKNLLHSFLKLIPNQIYKEILGEIPLIDRESLRLNKSKLDTFEKCPLQFKFRHVLKVPTPPRTTADVGNAVHSVIESATKYQIDGKTLSSEEILDMLEMYWDSRAFESETASNQAKKDAQSLLETFIEWNNTNPYTPIAVEKEFTLKMGGVKFNGFIDRIDKTHDGDYVVIDYKTGTDKITKNTIKDDLQMNLYALGTENLYGKLPAKTALFYLKKNKLVENKIEKEKVNEIKNTIEDTVQLILDEQFPAKPEYKSCMFCDFKDICDEKEIRE